MRFRAQEWVVLLALLCGCSRHHVNTGTYPYPEVWDLGVVPPSSKHAHTFCVLNSIRAPVSIERVVSNCACTVASITSQEVLPGEDALVDVIYNAPGAASDDTRQLVVLFQDKIHPPVVLKLKATIRPDIYVDTTHIELNAASPERVLHIENYGDREWDDLIVTSDVDWLSSRTTLLPRPESDRRTPRQRFRCVFQAFQGAPAIIGRHTATVQVSPVPRGEATQIEVTCHVKHPMLVVPSTLFFGRVPTHSESACSCEVLLRSDDTISGAHEPFRVSHSLDREIFNLELSPQDVNTWTLRGVVNPETPGIIDGTVHILCEGKDEHAWPPISIPVKAVAYLSQGED